MLANKNKLSISTNLSKIFLKNVSVIKIIYSNYTNPVDDGF